MNLPPDDQQVLELQHWIAADAMNLVHNEYSTSQVEPILLHSIDNLEMTTRTTNLLKSLEIYLI
ncbi:hypothetical protein H6769_05710 [Candidatus Peribacteria bacterium]|nr:hypothetical protein [Candidatus Peribacteria bacterium]